MAEANAVVARMAYEMAISGRCPAMTFFWMKCNVQPPEPVEDDEPQKNWTSELHFLDKNGVPTAEPQVIHGKA